MIALKKGSFKDLSVIEFFVTVSCQSTFVFLILVFDSSDRL